MRPGPLGRNVARRHVRDFVTRKAAWQTSYDWDYEVLSVDALEHTAETTSANVSITFVPCDAFRSTCSSMSVRQI